MAAVKGRDTGLEMRVRRWLHAEGYRYRVHRRDLPGSPDVVFPGRHKAVFLHGCFWHAHGCPSGRMPQTRTDFWIPKLERNRARDAAAEAALRGAGWDVAVIWECDVKKEWEKTAAALREFLGLPGRARTDGKGSECGQEDSNLHGVSPTSTSS